MQKRLRNIAVLLSATVVASGGCASKNPFTFFKRSSADTASTTRVVPQRQALAGGGVGQPRPEADTSVASSISTSFKNMTAKVSDALTIKPKVEPPADPIKLADSPDTVSADVYLATARRFESLQRVDESKDQYQRALQQQPKNHDALMGLAHLHDRLGEFADAEKYYRQAAATDPTAANVLNDLGLCLARQSKQAEAIATLQRAVKAAPDKVLYRNNLASLLVDADRSEEALRHLSAAHPPAVAHYNLGYLLYKRGDRRSAAEQFAIAVDQDPALAAARQMLAVTTGAAAQVASNTVDPERSTPAPIEGANSANQTADGNYLIRLPAGGASERHEPESIPPSPSE